ncbi:extensin family protein [Rhodobacteraceae bacterium M382]|nr:extensin family protein [Rhodobacteraceae bacterium M382]
MTRVGAYAVSLAVALAALPLAAAAPETSLRPQDRGDRPVLTIFTSGGSPLAPAAVPIRPVVRPGDRDPVLAASVAAAPVSDDVAVVSRHAAGTPAATPLIADPRSGLSQSPRPNLRPEAVEQAGLFTRKRKMKGSVCKDPDIKGEAVGRVPGKLNGCGVKDAVRVTSVSGVALSQGAIMDCETAAAVKTWVDNAVKPTFKRRGPVVSMRVAAHYSCRTRNNQPGGKISEHGKGKAIDISAFTMKDGEVITVLKGWREGTTRRMLSKIHDRACGPFGTVLGPKADRYHQDHFHLDTARHRGGPYCR